MKALDLLLVQLMNPLAVEVVVDELPLTNQLVPVDHYHGSYSVESRMFMYPIVFERRT